MKGIELGTTKRMSEVIAEVIGAGPERIAVISGPNLAREIAAARAGRQRRRVRRRGVAAAAPVGVPLAAFRPYRNTDVIGCELGGAYKNVVALGSGWPSASASGTTPPRR